MKKNMKVLIQLRNSLAGHRFHSWRYKNSGWKQMSELQTRYPEFYHDIHDDIKEISANNRGPTTKEMLSFGHEKNKAGFFVVEFDNYIDDPDIIRVDTNCRESDFCGGFKEDDVIPEDLNPDCYFDVYVSKYRNKYYNKVIVDAGHFVECYGGENGPYETYEKALEAGKDGGYDWLYTF